MECERKLIKDGIKLNIIKNTNIDSNNPNLIIKFPFLLFNFCGYII